MTSLFHSRTHFCNSSVTFNIPRAGGADARKIGNVVFVDDRAARVLPAPVAAVQPAALPPAVQPARFAYTKRGHALEERVRRDQESDSFRKAKAALYLPPKASASKCIAEAVAQAEELQEAEEELIAHINMQREVRRRLEARLHGQPKKRLAHDGRGASTPPGTKAQEARGTILIDAADGHARSRPSTHPPPQCTINFRRHFKPMSLTATIASLRRFGLGHTFERTAAGATWLKARKGSWRKAVQRMRAKTDACEGNAVPINGTGNATGTGTNSKASSARNAKRKQSTVQLHRGKRNKVDGAHSSVDMIDARLNTLITPLQLVQPYAHTGTKPVHTRTQPPLPPLPLPLPLLLACSPSPSVFLFLFLPLSSPSSSPFLSLSLPPPFRPPSFSPHLPKSLSLSLSLALSLCLSACVCKRGNCCAALLCAVAVQPSRPHQLLDCVLTCLLVL